jgi:hypothetical protein
MLTTLNTSFYDRLLAKEEGRASAVAHRAQTHYTTPHANNLAVTYMYCQSRLARVVFLSIPNGGGIIHV